MHELSIAQNILEIVTQHVSVEEQVNVKKVKLRIGAMAGVVPESLEFCFGVITDATPMRGASLEIEAVPFVAECGKCGNTISNESGIILCTLCGSGEMKVISGNELTVTEVELSEKKEVAA